MINIIINGANGKMARVTASAIAKEKELQLVATTTRHDDLISEIKKHHADVVIDWTTPDSVFDNTKKIISAGARAVIGTTGLTSDQIKILSDECRAKKLGVIIAPNFSVSAVLMMKYAQDAAKYFQHVEIVEYHHAQKKDAPSGTAKKTAELISGSAKNSIPIHSVRLPGIFSTQEVIFGGDGETLVLQHNAIDRNAMTPGLFLCCRKVMTLDHLVYGMESLL